MPGKSSIERVAAAWLGQKQAAPQQGVKATIYHKDSSFVGIGKTEGVLTGVSASGVGGAIHYVPKRGRRERVLMTYYSPWIMVVPGWNKPDPESPWEAGVSSQPGVTVQKGRYRSTDPRWVQDFMDTVGKRLRPIVLFENGKLKYDRSGLPKRTEGE